MSKNTILCVLFTLCATAGAAQSYSTTPTWQNSRQTAPRPLEEMDLGVTLGTTGIGVDISTPLSDMFRLRTGFEIMPRIEKTITFEIMSFDQYGNITPTQFDKMSQTLEMFTGYKADSRVDMVGKPTYWNFKLLVDVYPFRNKHWHITAGFHWGTSKIAEAINSMDESPTLFSVNMYNRMFDIADQDINHDNMIPLFTFADGQEIYLDPDVEKKLLATGQMGIQLGYYSHDITDEEGNVIHKDGDPYRMVPDDNCTVTAKVHANAFKPYLGFGYEGRLFKRDNSYKIGFDCGAMFWGGTPSIITHDGTDLAKDVRDIEWLPGDYINFIKGFKVFPVLNLRITKTFSLK
jgi:hypothetical protein